MQRPDRGKLRSRTAQNGGSARLPIGGSITFGYQLMTGC